jgi:hypothetical protein
MKLRSRLVLLVCVSVEKRKSREGEDKKKMRKSQGKVGDEAIKDFVELEGYRWRSNQRLLLMRR